MSGYLFYSLNDGRSNDDAMRKLKKLVGENQQKGRKYKEREREAQMHRLIKTRFGVQKFCASIT